MSFLTALVTGFLFAGGFYLILNRGLINRSLGLILISHGANFVLMTMGGLASHPKPPLLHSGDMAMADPLPQAFILTALVIGFAVAAFLWTLVLKLGKEDKA